MKLSLYNLRKGFRYLKNYGLKEFFIRLKEKGEPEQISYAEYAAGHKVTEAQLKIRQKNLISGPTDRLSVVFIWEKIEKMRWLC